MDHIGLASFATIYTQVQGYVQDSSADRLVKIKDRINWNLFDAYLRHDWRDLRRFHEGRHSHYTQADNTAAYSGTILEAFQTSGYEAMPYDVGEIFSITNGYPAGTMQTPPVLTKMDQGEFFEAISFDPDMVGVPEIYTLAGLTPLRRPLVTVEALRFVSTSSDTAAIRILGVTGAAYLGNNDGNNSAETVTLSGTTPVSSSLSYAPGWSILAIEVSAALAGTVTIAGALSGITYATLLPQASLTDGPNFKQRLLIRMWPCPTAGTPYSVYYKRKCNKLIADQDTPLWNIAPYLVEKSIADIYEQMRLPELGATHHAKADQMLVRMMQTEESAVMHMSRPMSIRGYMQGAHLVRPGP